MQEEPANQGAWPFMALNFDQAMTEVDAGGRWSLAPVTRASSSAPSVGSAKVHETQQRELTETALA